MLLSYESTFSRVWNGDVEKIYSQFQCTLFLGRNNFVLIKGGSYKKESVQKYIFLHCNHLIKEPQTKPKQMLLLAINGMNDVGYLLFGKILHLGY